MGLLGSRKSPDLRRAYFALVVVGGIGAHLASEFAAMGAAAGRIALAPVHYYLGVALIVAAAVLVRDMSALFSAATNGRDARRLAQNGLATLPFAGKRGFVTTTACLQFAVGWTTVVAEGSPLFGYDVGAGAIGAVVGALLLALFMRAASRRLPNIACAVVRLCPIVAETPQVRLVEQPDRDAFAQSIWCSRLFNRPPPNLQTA